MKITIIDEKGVLKEISFEYTDYNDSLLIAKIIEFTVIDNFDKIKKEILQEIEDGKKEWES